MELIKKLIHIETYIGDCLDVDSVGNTKLAIWHGMYSFIPFAPTFPPNISQLVSCKIWSSPPIYFLSGSALAHYHEIT